MKKIKKRGFTLTELVITVALIIILATISVPMYKDHISKAKLAEGYALLAAIREAQEAYFSEYDNFLLINGGTTYTNYEPILGIDARGNKYFTWFNINYEWRGTLDTKCAFKAEVEAPYGYCSDERTLYRKLAMKYNLTTGYTIRLEHMV
ncbi:MAG: prepilin-type N-terminal cleavage/methylation domain-containing protein [Elusimicrobia bacterium]|nr:prepilin-type N-terminal cleavage/methylation domain-containing protein [Elusimicrobiota bacterium]